MSPAGEGGGDYRGAVEARLPPLRVRVKAGRGDLCIINGWAASHGWELVLPASDFSSCSLRSACFALGTDANFGARLVERTGVFANTPRYGTVQL